MRDLPLSIHATPGMIAHAPAGLVPESDDDYAGLQVYHVARTAAIAAVRPPCFGHLTIKVGSKKPYRGGFLLLKLLSNVNNPARVAIVGAWVIDKEDLIKMYTANVLRTDKRGKAAFEALDEDDCILDLVTRECAGFSHFEPSIRVLRHGDELGHDRDNIKLGAVLRNTEYKTKGWVRLELLETLVGKSWMMKDLLTLLPKSFEGLMKVGVSGGVDDDDDDMDVIDAPGPLSPAPAGGIVPVTPSFETLGTDAIIMEGKIFLIGYRPGGHIYGLLYKCSDSGTINYGRIIEPPPPGKPPIIRPMLMEEEVMRYMDMHPGWEMHEKELVIITSDDLDYPLNSDAVRIVPGSMRPIVVVPNQHFFVNQLDRPGVTFLYNLYWDMEDRSLSVVEEPVTEMSGRTDSLAYHTLMGANSEAISNMLRNESRLQITNESQRNLANSTVILPAVEYGKFLSIPGAMDAEWIGDREQTLVKEFTNAEEINMLWPNNVNGWIVPERPPDKRHVKRRRAQRNHGYMKVNSARSTPPT